MTTFNVTHEYCEAYVDELMGLSDADKLRKLWDMCEVALRESAPGFPIIVGIVLRDRRIFDWAEYVFQLSMRIPHARLGALFELSMLESIRGRPDRSTMFLAEHEAEHPLSAYGERAYAHQLGRLGDLEGAARRLEASIAKEPESLRECVTLQQFFAYFHKFPAQDALRRATALTTVYPVMSASEVADEVMAALRDRRPYSLVRLNDGDGAFLSFGIEDESEFAELYSRNRREWLRLIFGNEDMLYSRDWWDAVGQFPAVIASADCLGAHHYYSLEGEYAWGSIRNVPCIFNIVRQLELSHASGVADAKLCSPQVNQALLFEGHLERLIGSQTQLGLISCHSALPQALAQRFGLSEVFFHKTTGEAAVAGGEKEPFAVWHRRISAELEHARAGVLYLVGAGPAGKMYCDLIKKAGGVALDIGAVADVWMNTNTREFHQDVSKHGLAA